MNCDWKGFYGIVDPEHCRGDVLKTADGILAAGCAVLQLRDKRGNLRDQLALARALKARCVGRKIPFVMNDRLDLALLVDADGLHLGQDDLPVTEVRRHFRGIIGVSTHNLEQALAAARDADLIGFGPVFATATKHNPDPIVGLERLAEVAASVPVPVVAIGGISIERAKDTFTAGASLIAAISAVCQADDPGAAARAFVEAYA